MEQPTAERILSDGLSRRTVVKSAAWSVPVLVAAAAVPMASASTTACTKTISTATAAYSRASATASQFVWPNLFGDGKDFTLTLTAVHALWTNMAINQANNLVLDSGMNGGEAQPSVHLSLDTLALDNTGGGEKVTFDFALGGVSTSVTNLTYKIKDIDGFMALDGKGGAERVFVSAGTGTYDSAWVQGSGTDADRWRLSTAAPNVEVAPTSSAGNVAVTVPATSSFDLTYVVNNSGRAPSDRPNQNIWLGPFTFTVSGFCKP
ncbi:MAG: hypothetical protein LBE60_12935 [Microbacterium sp.]|jgi:hypothetical protein|uniref:hypothetical protein n=1 Tax=Microbacterium sp. TaxID=51671 RepID=UPI002818B4F6|nr:hypothetical protein [Microbacterium sp.]MDR2322543.1 hypothetical protein [Microbacterium sp.]